MTKYNTFVCVGLPCDTSNAPEPSERRYTVWLSAKESQNGKFLLPARSEDIYRNLDYQVESGPEEKYFIKSKPAPDFYKTNGPIYRGVESGLDACKRADLTSRHLQFYSASPDISCATAHTADPAMGPRDIQEETFYPNLALGESNRQPFCFIKIRVQSTIHSTVNVFLLPTAPSIL